jgi:hypothetical protein
MHAQRISVGISSNHAAGRRQHSRAAEKTPSQLVRVARELGLRRGSVSSSAYESARAAGLIGGMHDALPDLSSSLHLVQDFGNNK